MSIIVAAGIAAFVACLFIVYRMARSRYRPLDRPGRQRRIMEYLRDTGPAFAATMADDLNMSPKVLGHELVLLSQMGSIVSENVDVRTQQLTHRRLYRPVHVDPTKRGGRHRKPPAKRDVMYLDPEALIQLQLTARGMIPARKPGTESVPPLVKTYDPDTEKTREIMMQGLRATTANESAEER